MRRCLFRGVVLRTTFVVVAFSLTVLAQAQLDQKPLAFEVASVKPLGEADPRVLAALGGGCDGGFPRVEHSRFTVATTSYALISWAYGFNKNGGCGFATYGGFITGGPDWIRSERIAVEALMPNGSPQYTTAQFMNGEAPQLEVMIKNLLADRFHLTVHREMKDVPGYFLLVGNNGPKIRPSTDQDAFVPRERRGPATAGSRRIYVRTTMTYVALTLGMITRRPVEDRTGLTGEYLFDLEYAPEDAAPGESAAASVFTAVQEQLGLKLEAARVRANVIAIDHVERPTPD